MADRDVVVVGGGPVGLTAALALHARGHTPTVVEAGTEDRVRPGSRAIFIHRESLQVLERIQPGLGHALNAHGVVWTTKRTLYRGRLLYHRRYGPLPEGTLPPATSLPQVVTEQVLCSACRDAGIEFIWNTTVVRAAACADGVVLETDRSGPISSRYVIAADGARSAVRESSGLTLEGPRTTNAFAIVDVAEDPAAPRPLERVFHYEHPEVGYRNVLTVPFAGHWRIDLQCHADDDPEAFSGPDGVRRWLPQAMPERYADRVTWVSTYVFRQAIANSFTDERRKILLVGEAAHLFAPFGARGLNSGIADAYIAALAVDRALVAAAPQGSARAIDDFAETRRAAAARNRAASSTALRHLVASSTVDRVIRRAGGLLAPWVTSIARWMDRAPYGPQLGGVDRDGMRY